ncbi:hypothetical protein AB0B89_27115 [Sphaerisporangium sp. NPDC049002]
MRDIDLERDVVRLPYGLMTVRAGWLDRAEPPEVEKAPPILRKG